MSETKVKIPCRISFANIWEPKSINGSEDKYSVSCIISKKDTKTIGAINAAVEAAKEASKTKKMRREDSIWSEFQAPAQRWRYRKAGG